MKARRLFVSLNSRPRVIKKKKKKKASRRAPDPREPLRIHLPVHFVSLDRTGDGPERVD